MKFKFWNFLNEIQNSICSIDWSFCSINQSDEENKPRVSTWFNCCLIHVRSNEKSPQSMLDSSQSIKTHKTKFSPEFSINYSECLKRFQALWMVLWKILTLHTCLLMEYNPMGINRGLCSLEIPVLSLQKLVWKETQEILWVLSKIVTCKTQQLGCILWTNLW